MFLFHISLPDWCWDLVPYAAPGLLSCAGAGDVDQAGQQRRRLLAQARTDAATLRVRAGLGESVLEDLAVQAKVIKHLERSSEGEG